METVEPKPDDAHNCLPREKTSTDFHDSRTEEISGLISNGTFAPTIRSIITGGTRVFWSGPIDELKRGERGLRRMSRLVSHNYADQDTTSIATIAQMV